MKRLLDDWLVPHALELLLLLLAAGAFGWSVVATIRVAGTSADVASDLTFAGTLDELTGMLEIGGRDSLARLERVTLPVGEWTVIVDTVAVVADVDREPGAARGGFIADQIALYNDHAIRQALGDALSSPDSRTGIDTEGPSLLRAVMTEDGARELSKRPNPFLLTVRSPNAERAWRNVYTSDRRMSGGLLGLEGDLPLSADVADASLARLNGRDCEIRNDSPRVLLYCSSSMASSSRLFYDFGFNISPASSGRGPTTVFTYRENDVFWSNGERQFATPESPRGVGRGDVFDVGATGPFMVSAAEQGALAAGQWINGRQTFSNQRLGTLSFFAAAGRSTTAGQGPLVLALDAALSMDLETEARRFLAAARAPRPQRMSVVVMDARTGQLRAIAEPTRAGDGEPLLAYEPILVGSVVKPILATAILARRPELAEMTLPWAGSVMHSVNGTPLAAPFANAANGCGSTITFTDFLRCSSNQYAAELLVRSLGLDGYRPEAGVTDVPRAVLDQSAIAVGLAEVFDVDASGERTAGRSPRMWAQLMGETPGEANGALNPWEPRPWIIFPDDDGTRLDWIARYAFGGWENRWTLLSVAEAYSRIATSRPVRTRLLDEAVPDGGSTVAAGVDSAASRVREGLRRVGLDGTAAGLSTVMRGSLPEAAALLAKTGTLNEDTDRFKSLALVLGIPEGDGPSAAFSCGLTAVAYFEFSDGTRTVTAPLPSVHLEFARNALAGVLGRHWDRVSGCPRPDTDGP